MLTNRSKLSTLRLSTSHEDNDTIPSLIHESADILLVRPLLWKVVTSSLNSERIIIKILN
jgi:hypothetical protein